MEMVNLKMRNNVMSRDYLSPENWKGRDGYGKWLLVFGFLVGICALRVFFSKKKNLLGKREEKKEIKTKDPSELVGVQREEVN